LNKKTDGRILMAHGSGGQMTRALVTDIFRTAFSNDLLNPLNDQAVFESPGARLAFTTDSYVVSPIFFPGGDIGHLAVCGTINDLAVGGAEPLYLSASFIIEEGLEVEELRRVVNSMAETARASGVKIVTGDTKVVERGHGDKIFINTAGVGRIADGVELGPELIRPGDAVILSGTAGDHGMAVLAGREGLEMELGIESDCAPLWTLAKTIIDAGGGGVRAMRDATRGGVATVLCEFAESSDTCITISEETVPVSPAVRGACEMLGFEPLYLANEGKLVAVVDAAYADAVAGAMRAHPYGRNAAVIGTVAEAPAGRVLLETTIGNTRPLEMLSGEQLPRIC